MAAKDKVTGQVTLTGCPRFDEIRIIFIIEKESEVEESSFMHDHDARNSLY